MLRRIASIALFSLALSGCGFWGGSEEVQPNKLVDFTAEKKVVVRWSANIGGDLGDKFHQMTPAISGDSIFAASVDGAVSSFNVETGSKLWSVDLDVALLAGVGAGISNLAVATQSGVIICLDATTGAELWRKQVSSEVVAAPQLNNQIVVAQLINGQIVALDLQSGVQRWVYDSLAPRLTLRGTSSPIVAADVTLAGLDNGKFVALDNESGSVLWEQNVSLAQGRSELERMTDVDGRPLLFENVVYIAGFQGNLVAINPFNAQTLWAKKMSSYHSLAAGFGNIYVSESVGHVQALDARSAASVWRQDQLENRQITAPAVIGNAVAVGDSEGYVHFLSQIDGHFVARYDTGSRLVGDMKVKGSTLYALTDAGRLLALTLN
ncbi:outer membrane protein assembly factor BamB [Neptunomonas qingdaonensis]|uniref:Outer membrane protein assembly factor BamB n=1 Tax=Neptunomonas qingdaonensis TaxID=1045558 RepID=A0A1I2UC50_9GAMM|nr:outer membrane protein assembly factor BamB [Neptunomonas qingdaonensis]SFG74775.1 outer membrane protein assembly factor BamB [Neptunomonas qingdaonensis]